MAIDAANRAQNAHSPAKETMKIGHNFGMGEVIGIEEMLPRIRRAGARSVETALSAAEENSLRFRPFAAAGAVLEAYPGGSGQPGAQAFDYDRMARATAKAMEGMTVEVDERQFGRVIRKAAAL